MDRNANKIVLVTQRSRLQELMHKYNTKAQAQFHIEHMGADFSDYVLEDENYQKSLAVVKQIADKYAKVTVVDREFVPNMLFGKDDIVIAVGRDGLVCNTMKYLNGQKLIGVNPDPLRWDGVLLPFEAGELENTIPKTITGDCDVREVAMAKAVTNDGQEMLAVNDFFIGPKSHTSARYDLTTRHIFGRVVTESQSSSGIIVSKESLPDDEKVFIKNEIVEKTGVLLRHKYYLSHHFTFQIIKRMIYKINPNVRSYLREYDRKYYDDYDRYEEDERQIEGDYIKAAKLFIRIMVYCWL